MPPLQATTWTDLREGELVWIDNYQDGKFPQASPRVSGPFIVADLQYRRLRTIKSNRSFMHYPNNLLKYNEARSPCPS